MLGFYYGYPTSRNCCKRCERLCFGFEDIFPSNPGLLGVRCQDTGLSKQRRQRELYNSSEIMAEIRVKGQRGL